MYIENDIYRRAKTLSLLQTVEKCQKSNIIIYAVTLKTKPKVIVQQFELFWKNSLVLNQQSMWVLFIGRLIYTCIVKNSKENKSPHLQLTRDLKESRTNQFDAEYLFYLRLKTRKFKSLWPPFIDVPTVTIFLGPFVERKFTPTKENAICSVMVCLINL